MIIGVVTLCLYGQRAACGLVIISDCILSDVISVSYVVSKYTGLSMSIDKSNISVKVEVIYICIHLQNHPFKEIPSYWLLLNPTLHGLRNVRVYMGGGVLRTTCSLSL